MAEFRIQHGLASGNGVGGTLNDQRVVDLRNQLVALRSEQLTKKGQLQRAQAARSRGGDALADLGPAATVIMALRSQLSDLERRKAELALLLVERIDARAH